MTESVEFLRKWKPLEFAIVDLKTEKWSGSVSHPPNSTIYNVSVTHQSIIVCHIFTINLWILVKSNILFPFYSSSPYLLIGRGVLEVAEDALIRLNEAQAWSYFWERLGWDKSLPIDMRRFFVIIRNNNPIISKISASSKIFRASHFSECQKMENLLFRRLTGEIMRYNQWKKR
jgi:hypothetical protein